MSGSFWLVLNFLIIILISNIGMAQQSPYQDLEERDIKSLSQKQIEGYLEGRGMGMALAAELNNYPGPKHVLELSDSLNITAEQKKQIEAIFNAMHEEAIELGKLIVAKEKEMDRLFASGKITDNSLASLLTEIGDLKGKLRFAHLRAHLKTAEMLDSAQIKKYSQLRGYLRHHMHHHRQHQEHP